MAGTLLNDFLGNASWKKKPSIYLRTNTTVQMDLSKEWWFYLSIIACHLMYFEDFQSYHNFIKCKERCLFYLHQWLIRKTTPNRTTDNPSLPTPNHQDRRQGDPYQWRRKQSGGEGGG